MKDVMVPIGDEDIWLSEILKEIEKKEKEKNENSISELLE